MNKPLDQSVKYIYATSTTQLHSDKTRIEDMVAVIYTEVYKGFHEKIQEPCIWRGCFLTAKGG